MSDCQRMASAEIFRRASSATPAAGVVEETGFKFTPDAGVL